MREIKFRVWTGSGMEYNVTAGKFGTFFVNPGDGNGLDPKDSASLNPANTKYHDDVPVMQYTGLKDKNSKEIYEGDIIKGGIYLAYYVEWDYKENGWNVCNTSGFEVIGNIYENTELI